MEPPMNCSSRVYLYVLIILLHFLTHPFAEVCKLVYTGIPEDLNDSIIQIPSEAVMMSENILVGIPGVITGDSIIAYETPSIFFVIDHSGSMSTSNNPKDRWGNRFTVTRQLLDTINEIYPNAEIGISVFGSNLYFDPIDDSSIIDEVTGLYSNYYDGGYLKLLKLDSTYDSEVGTMSGYDLLCHYLETDTVGFFSKYVELKYEPSTNDLKNNSTNITAGFDAVKSAYKNSSAQKKNQYVIFFSDGEARAPSKNDTVMNAFKDGDSVPTTFTIYFTADSTIPDQIDTMTQNIKNNNYSENNIYTNAWSFDNTGSDTLKNFILSNIFSIISTKTISTPIDISVNGKIPDTSIVNDSTTLYKFSSTFPFTGVENDFHYEIIYSLYTDSIIGDNDTIKSEKLDTTISDFTLELAEGAELPDNFDLLCWDRFIEFYYQGQKIEYANETMDSIEIRFIPKEISMLYEYEDIEINLETLDPGNKDIEKISMNQPAEYFTIKAAISMGDAIKNDKMIQVKETDTIIAIFRNDYLPLDTLRASLPFRLSNLISMDEASCFDNDANGYADSIFIKISGKDLNGNSNDLDQIISHITLPSVRDFEIASGKIYGNGIALKVNENSGNINTSTKGEKISIDKFILNGGGLFSSGTVSVKDCMAPVIVSASAIQYESEDMIDTLIVSYSESINGISSLNPSYFLNANSLNNYDVNINTLDFKNNNSRVIFEIESIVDSDMINNGDSIWINWNGDNIGDQCSYANYQRNERNVKRPINTIYSEMPYIIDYAVYFDNNADGFADSIFISVENKNTSKLENELDELISNVKLPSFRNFSISKIDLYSNGFGLTVLEGNSSPNTSTINDTIIVEKIVLTEGSVITARTLPVIDKMAPVIVSALAIQYEDDDEIDSLSITYSEKINEIDNREPSLFCRPLEQSNFSVELELINVNNNIKNVLFSIYNISGASMILEGDSIWINWNDECVSDILNEPNYQLNRKNIRQPIEVVYHQQPIDIDISVVSPINFKDLDNSNLIPDHIVNILNEKNLEKLKQDNDEIHGMIIKTDLKSEIKTDVKLVGEFTLYDYLGNTLVNKVEMSFNDDDNSLYYVWNGKNENGRLVGSGTYLGLFEISTDPEGSLSGKKDFSFKKFILVKD